MAHIMKRLSDSWDLSLDTIDARIEHGIVDTTMPMMEWSHLIVANLAYFAVIGLLFRFMKNREAFKLTAFMRWVHAG